MNGMRRESSNRAGALRGREPGPRAMRVVRTLAPSSPGALRLAQRYGRDLVCVRHRLDASGEQRVTTVELIVDVCEVRSRGLAEREVALKLNIGERELRARLQQAGARWDAAAKLWWLPRGQVLALGLADRIVDPSARKNG